jgi:hypothetical protein
MTYSIRRIQRGAAALFALALCASSAPASADDVGNEPAAPEAVVSETDWIPVSEAELAQRGTGTPPSLEINASTSSTMGAVVLGNYVGDYVMTGDVSIGDNAVSGMNGFGQFIFNTGNNNSIQTNLFVIVNLD